MELIRKLVKRLRRKKEIRSRHSVSPIVISELNKRNYEVTDFLGYGAFSEVICLKNNETNLEVAAKIVKKKNVILADDKLWPLFNHPNIIFLNEIIFLKGFNVYLMPKMDKTLFDAFSRFSATRNPNAFSLLKCCLVDVLRGLEYLHSNKICYVDLKSDNILLDSNMKAVICDFNWCYRTEKIIHCYRKANYYTSPEACCQSGWICIDGFAHDIWTFGVMVFVILFGAMTDIKYGELIAENWEEQLFDMFYILLQEKIFFNWVRIIFGRSELDQTTDLRLALNLIRSCLRKKPDDRPKICTILQHGLWLGEPDKVFEEDSMWFDDCSSSETDQEQESKDYQFSHDELEDHIRNIKHANRKQICYDLFRHLKFYYPRKAFTRCFQVSSSLNQGLEQILESFSEINTFYKNQASRTSIHINLKNFSEFHFWLPPLDGIENNLREKLQFEELPFIDEDDDQVSTTSDEKDDQDSETSDEKDDQDSETSDEKDDQDSETSDAKNDYIHTSNNKAL